MTAGRLLAVCLLPLLSLGAACGGGTSNPGEPGGSGPGGSNSGGGDPGGGNPGGNGPGPGGAGGAGGTDLAAAVTDAVCDNKASCGDVQVFCSGGDGGPTSCDAYLEPVPYEECSAAEGPHYTELFACVTPSSAEVAEVQKCVSLLGAQACPTQAELDAYAAAVQNGQGGTPPGQPPGACGVLHDLAIACDAVKGCEESSSGSGSGGISTCSVQWACFSGTYRVDCSTEGDAYLCTCGGGGSVEAFTSSSCMPSASEVNDKCGFQLPT